MILGINTSHDCAFCLLDDEGKPLYILEEERFNRIKHTGFRTLISLETLLREGLMNPADVSDLVYSFEMDDDVSLRLMDQCYENAARSFGQEVFHEASRYFHQPEDSFSPTRGLGLETGFDEALSRLRAMFPNAREASYMHHLCHAASAFYPSPFQSAAVMILDGSGRLETTTIWHATENGLALLREIDLPHSIGILYWLFSHYIALEEGQTMGLAAYGRPVYEDLLYDKVITIDREGLFAFKAPIVSWFDMDNEYSIRIIESLFGVKARHSQYEPLTQFHADVAASIQRVTEKVLVRIARCARQLTSEDNLCLAGGVIQNCVANGHLVSERVFDNVWIQPMANDGGTALGAAIHHYYTKRPDRRRTRWKMTTAQLGLGHTRQNIESHLKRLKIPYRKSKACAKEAAEAIAKGNIIGWFQSAAEVGPRALGGRCILADARSKFNRFAVNGIKHRQPWRPFAPSILGQHLKDYFHPAQSSPYMILSFPLTSNASSEVPAVSHVDGTARVQTVAEDGGEYYKLLVHLHESTGVPVVLNTSFNLRAEPMVQHPLEAIRDFLVSGLEQLVLGDCIIQQKPALETSVLTSLAASRFVSLYDFYLRDSGTTIFVRHDGLGDRQTWKSNHLRLILDWLGITFQEVLPSTLAETIAACQDDVNLISVAPLLDEESLRRLPRRVIQKVNVSVLDHRMFMFQTTASDLLEIISVNRHKLHMITGERRIAACADGCDLEEIVHDLRLLGVRISEAISPREMTARTRDDEVFMITSFAAMDELKSEFRRLGYHSGQGYLVWNTEQ